MSERREQPPCSAEATQDKQEWTPDDLEYIANSPPQKHGGFHHNTVRAAKEALVEIKRLNAVLAAAYSSCKETVQTAHAECSAALATAAEDQRRIDYAAIINLRDQLAAERVNAEAWRLACKGKEKAYAKLEQQLAAEQEEGK